jgi:D-beta-D-heptose 7-phosphate kinase/D-beta-D-heptose 1-phosphate adenosyltransferase
MSDLIQALERFGSPRVAVLGDYMLDGYVYGDVERISPEAPVPVLRIVRREELVGGAGRVAAAVPALGARAVCIGVLGEDSGGAAVKRLLAEAGAETGRLLALPARPTAVKTRYVGLAQHRSPQQLLRVDEEPAGPLDESAQQAIQAALRAELPACDIVVLEDYNKGVLDDRLTPLLIADARRAGKAVVVDPARIADYRRYRGATVLKPNRYEAAEASGIPITDDASMSRAAAQLCAITEAQAVVISLDRDGAYVYRAAGAAVRVPHWRPRAVYDVAGAGDETTAVLAVMLAAGLDYVQAAELANAAGGLEVERFGFVPIHRHELAEELRRMAGPRSGKVLDRAALHREVERRRALGEAIVFTNGCFDLLHMGHVRYLQQARQLGACLIVAINTDAGVKRLKGAGRPVIGQNERAEMLASLECVDYVTLFDEDTPVALLELLRPDALAKGGTTPVVVGRELVEGYGGRVVTLDMVAGLSTTQIIERILAGNTGR